MDVISHGLWAGAAALLVARRHPVTRAQFGTAVALGVAPDMAQLLPVALWSLGQERPMDLVKSFVNATPGNEPMLPDAVAFLSHHLHCIFHSVVVLAVATAAAWRLLPWLLVPLLGWWLHVLLDIPTHSTDYYAVPFLYPLTYRGVNGIAWTTPWVLATNYILLALAYCALYRTRRLGARRGPPGSSAA